MTSPSPKKTTKSTGRKPAAGSGPARTKASRTGASAVASPGAASSDEAFAGASSASGPATSGSDDSLPGPEAVEALLAPVRAFARSPEQARLRGFLERLAAAPPQVLLLEGGTADERLAAAHYWTLLLNCDCRNAGIAGRADAGTGARAGVGTGSGAAADDAVSPATAPAPVEQPALPGLTVTPSPAQPGLPGLTVTPSPTQPGLPGLAAAAASSALPGTPAAAAASAQPGLLPGLSVPSSPEAASTAPLPHAPATAFSSGNSRALAEETKAEGARPDLPLPCLCCPSCIRMTAHLHRDCFFLDGTAGSIKIDDVRAVRAVLGEPPREARYRVVLFREAQALVEAAANALLKSFEDPRPATSFILLTPQRERLLPTLVSRSFSLTLPWPKGEDAADRAELAPLEAALCTFLRTGRDLFERTGTKGAVDAAKAHALTGLCRAALAACIKARKGEAPPTEGLGRALLPLPETRLRMLDEALAECQDSLIYGVNPALVVEWLATRMYFLLPRQ